MLLIIVVFLARPDFFGLYLIACFSLRVGWELDARVAQRAYGALMPSNQLAYLELPSTNVATLKQFYGVLFGWTFEDFGDDYAAVHGSGLEVGLNGDAGSKSKSPLPMIETTRIEAMEAMVRDAGGTITTPTFAYPGGRRFHFVDPDGNEMAVMQSD